MSRWNHSICLTCWDTKYPGREPVCLVGQNTPEPCCFCEGITYAGIYVRYDPKHLKCGGVHGDDTEAGE